MGQNRSKQTDNERRQRASNPKGKTYDRPGIRSTVYQHHSHPLNRRGATGEVGTSWNTDGARTVGLYDLEPRDALRPRGPDLAQPGSVRAFEWARLDAALVRASPDRNQGGNADYELVGRPSVSLDDIRRFRQLDSKAPGHPEYHWVSGVETTTGPLGQGVATSVGMAIGQKWLASHFNQPGFDVFDYHIYTVCGDGDMMEGIGSEAASLAGHLGLDNLCWVYDNNHITS